MKNERFKDDNGDWFYTNTQGVTKKLLFSSDTNKPYTNGDTILDGKFEGRVFTQYRYDRAISMYDNDYWGIKTRVVAKELSRDVTGYKIPTPAVISFSGGRTSAFMLKQIVNAYGGKLPEEIL